MTMTENPLVTLSIISYNQEKYIREAVLGALGQTYSPLVIAFSDDASSDKTYETIQQLCAAYSGPHLIRCTKNATNLGLAEHINLINQVAEGELIVVGAGDDISVPERVERIVRSYLEGGKRSHYFYSLVTAMTEDGTLQGAYQSPGHRAASSVIRSGLASYPIAIGASQAWTKFLANQFGPMNKKIWAEDQVFGFRGVLLGPVTFLNSPLVSYRSGTGLSGTKRRFELRRYIRNQTNVLRMYRQRAIDAFAANRPWVGILIGSKAVVLAVLFPLSPLFSILRKMDRFLWR